MSINKIPAEIWDDIVELCHDADDWEVGRRLSQINKHFKETMLSTPLPWRRLRLTVPDLSDENEQKSFDEWAIELNRRSGNSMKHIKVIADKGTVDPDFGVGHLLRRFNAIDTFTLDIGAREHNETFLVECPRAKHVYATAGVNCYDSGSSHVPPEAPDLSRLDLHRTVESVNCQNMLLHGYYPPREERPFSLKSATIDFSGSYRSFVISKQNYDRRGGRPEPNDDDDEDDDDDYYSDPYGQLFRQILRDNLFLFNVFDDDQFKVVAASKQLESLSVAYTDAHRHFSGVEFPSLKSLSVQKSACNFLRKSHLPVLESLRLINCHISESEIWEALSNCMIKHLDLNDTTTPSFNFNHACIVSLSLESSPKELERLIDSSDFANFTSLKALNVSFTDISLYEVLFIVGQVNLEQLICDLPGSRKRHDCAALESAVAKTVSHYWTRNKQYYEDIKKNNDLEQYFFPHHKANADLF